MDSLGFLKSLYSSIKAVIPYLRGTAERYANCTEEYPDSISSRTAEDLSPKTKGALINDLKKCTGCGDCISLCPSNALEMDAEIVEDGSTEVHQFRIDHGRCIFCSICVDHCPVESIVHRRDFELAVASRPELVRKIDQTGLPGAKPNIKSIEEKIKMIRAYEVRK